MSSLLPGRRALLRLALPIIVSNLSTPLLGLVDTAVLGRLPGPDFLGAAALGALIFTVLFWAFGSLRMGTTGLTAQALGSGNLQEVSGQLGRGLGLAASLGLLLILVQSPVATLAIHWLDAPAAVAREVLAYYSVRIYSAPLALGNYVLLGWFLGLGRTRSALLLQVVLNVTNLVLDAYLVLVVGLQTEGVAWGTLLAEATALGVGLVLVFRTARALALPTPRLRASDLPALLSTLKLNANISVRTLSLVAIFALFQQQSAALGAVTLAATAVLLQLVSFSAYFLDGIAFATEALVGRAIGERDMPGLRRSVRHSTEVATGLALMLSLGFALSAPVVIELLAQDEAVRAAAKSHVLWAIGAPLAGVFAFQLDGIFIGATLGFRMRNGMLLTLGAFLLALAVLRPLGAHGLWAALYFHYVARTAALALQLRHVYAQAALPAEAPSPAG